MSWVGEREGVSCQLDLSSCANRRQSECMCVCGKKGRSWPSKVGWREVHVGTGGCELGIEGRRKKWRKERWE